MARMNRKELRDFLEKCGPRGVLLLDAAFEMWAHDGQLPPLGESWRVWLMMAGRGFGKTRAGAEWVNNLAQSAPKRIALVAASIDEARSIISPGRTSWPSGAGPRRPGSTCKWACAQGFARGRW
jgi:phage terminase large subunit-like protein